MLRDLLKKELLKITGLAEAKLAEPEREEHGDYTTNAAFKMGPPAGGAEKIAEKLRKSELVKEVAVKNKFINIFLKDEVLLKALSEEVKSPKKKEKINVEFVSANPTGPLTMANARGGVYGDALSKVLKKFKTEKRDGAVWFASPAGEWVLVKSDGEATYFLADLAYHYDKFFKRKFDLAIDVWGADHAGHIERLKKGMEALGVNSDRLKIIIVQLVRLVSDGKEARMSKRTGEF